MSFLKTLFFRRESPKKIIKRFLPLIILFAVMVVSYFGGLNKYLTFDALREYFHVIKAFVIEHPIGSPFIFLALYAFVCALSMPAEFVLTIMCGIFFRSPSAPFM